MVVDIPINCCVRLLHLVPTLLYLTLWDGKHKVQLQYNKCTCMYMNLLVVFLTPSFAFTRNLLSLCASSYSSSRFCFCSSRRSNSERWSYSSSGHSGKQAQSITCNVYWTLHSHKLNFNLSVSGPNIPWATFHCSFFIKH